MSASNGRLAALVLAPALLVGGTVGSLLLVGSDTTSPATSCGVSGPAQAVALTSLPAGSVAGYSGVQLVNAAHIMNAATTLGLSARAQAIGVMTAMGESSLVVVDHGDAVGPDSRGLFQQRANGAWGSYADRMDPATSATNFFKALVRVQGWDTLPPTIAAHRVQANQDPYHYEPYWDAAVAVVDALANARQAVPAVNSTPAGSSRPAAQIDAACAGASPASLSADGWAKPAAAPITSRYGMRRHPITGVLKLHSGTDLGAACGAPIYAAGDGVVVRAGASTGYGNLIVVDHGSGTVTRYAHMFNNGLLVRVGDQVSAGQRIALVGSNGYSTGCHLHFEVQVGGQFTDPEPFMAQRGVSLG